MCSMARSQAGLATAKKHKDSQWLLSLMQQAPRQGPKKV